TWSSDRQPAPAEGERAHRCGRCASCVLRRQALLASDNESLDASDRYRTDVLDHRGPEDELLALRLMLGQVAELSTATSAARPWAQLTESYPELIEARDALLQLGHERQVEERLVCLYRSYVEEWRVIVAPTVQSYVSGARS